VLCVCSVGVEHAHTPIPSPPFSFLGSLFNAELALSVTMSALSTIISVIMLPLNLLIYSSGSYSSSVVKSLDWYALFTSLFVVIGGISSGLFCSAYFKDSPTKAHKMHKAANRLGNIAGIILVTYSIFVSSSDHQAALWDQEWQFFVGIGIPAVIGITIATILATSFKLDKPERVAVAVESCYQNTAIATSVAVVMFEGDQDAVAQAISVPLFYGIVEAVLLAIFCLICWKVGWTKAPVDEKLCVILATSYECEGEELVAQAPNVDLVLSEEIEVCDSESGDCEAGEGDAGLSMREKPNLVFEETEPSETADSEHALRDPPDGPVVLRKSDSHEDVAAELELRTRANKTDDDRPENHNSPSHYNSTGENSSPTPLPSPDNEMDSSEGHDEAGVGRLRKTISHVKARARGYRRAPLPGDDSRNSRIPRTPSSEERVSGEITNSDGQYKDATAMLPESEEYAPPTPLSPSRESESIETSSPNRTLAEGKSID